MHDALFIIKDKIQSHVILNTYSCMVCLNYKILLQEQLERPDHQKTQSVVTCLDSSHKSLVNQEKKRKIVSVPLHFLFSVSSSFHSCITSSDSLSKATSNMKASLTFSLLVLIFNLLNIYSCSQ